MNGTLQSKIYKVGYYISLLGTVAILLWIALLKFTPPEANGIKLLVENSPFTSWMYDVWSVSTTAKIIGISEIIIVILIILSIWFSKLRIYATLGMTAMFLVTISFWFTTPAPGGWLQIVDGLPMPNANRLKDIMFLGFGLMLINFPKNKQSI